MLSLTHLVIYSQINIWRGGNNVISANINNINSKKKGKSAFNEKSGSNDKRTQTVTCTPKTMLHRVLQYEDFITPSPEERRGIILKAHLLGRFGVKAVEQTIHGDNIN
jgi:hypothetical protein